VQQRPYQTHAASHLHKGGSTQKHRLREYHFQKFQNATDEITIDGRMEEHGWRDNEATGAIKDHAREVSRLADDGGIARAIEMIMHLIDEARDLVAQNLNGDRIHQTAPFSKMRLR
jgi:uncharacterized protein YfdQ (DUF2303 family)